MLRLQLIDGLVAEWIGGHTADVMETLRAGDVPVTKVYDGSDILKDPQFQAREMPVPVEWPGQGTVDLPGVVPRLSRTPGSIRSHLPQRSEMGSALLRLALCDPRTAGHYRSIKDYK